MKIISKFQDYYDIGIAYGVDEKLRFERVTEYSEKMINKLKSVTKIVYKKEGQNYRIFCYYNVILFCAKIYPLIYIRVENIHKKDKKYIYSLVDEEYSYTINDAMVYINQNYKNVDEIYVKDSDYYVWNDITLKEAFTRHFDEKYDECISEFEVFKRPYFYIGRHYYINEKGIECISKSTILSPQLKKYKFAKIVPPMQAFQEISMYLGKLNAVEDNTVTIEDKYLAQGKGFDCYSFKKMPRKRKEKSC